MMRYVWARSWVGLVLLLAFKTSVFAAIPGKVAFDYSECLFGETGTLSVNVTEIDRERGVVTCGGADTTKPAQPFTWQWGDGETSTGFFPQTHRYKDRGRNYVVAVTSHRPDGTSETTEALVCFGPLSAPFKKIELPPGNRVVIPAKMPDIEPARAPYGVSSDLTVFDDSFFEACSRDTVQYVLSLAAAVQMDLANDDVCMDDGRFIQMLLRDPECGGMYSIWFTDPVCFGVGDYGFKGHIEWSSFFHEMGHNVTLNSPADFHWGRRQDGPANSMYSEVLAQIFQHATAYELVNNRNKYGISPDLAFDIARSAQSSMRIVRRSYEEYVAGGCRFCSWNDDDTERDDTFHTFMTVAYKFLEHAEKDGRGYQRPVKRLMTFLQRFNPKWEKRFSARDNNARAERFRATLSCAALSYAFETDLRREFRELRFPIDDDVFQWLISGKDRGGR